MWEGRWALGGKREDTTEGRAAPPAPRMSQQALSRCVCVLAEPLAMGLANGDVRKR